MANRLRPNLWGEGSLFWGLEHVFLVWSSFIGLELDFWLGAWSMIIGDWLAVEPCSREASLVVLAGPLGW